MAKGGKREGAGRKPAAVKRESYYFRLTEKEYEKMKKYENTIKKIKLP